MIDIKRRTSKMEEVNLIPLINVVFLLLIFFLVAGSIERSVLIPLDFPAADGGEFLEEGPIEIVLGKHDEIVVNEELIMMDEMATTMVKTLEKNRHAVITIKADSRLPAERLIRIMSIIKRAGGVNVSLVTQSPQ